MSLLKLGRLSLTMYPRWGCCEGGGGEGGAILFGIWGKLKRHGLDEDD
jgi:hypothetical protein